MRGAAACRHTPTTQSDQMARSSAGFDVFDVCSHLASLRPNRSCLCCLSHFIKCVEWMLPCPTRHCGALLLKHCSRAGAAPHPHGTCHERHCCLVTLLPLEDFLGSSWRHLSALLSVPDQPHSCSAKMETVEIIGVPLFQNAMCKQQFGLMRPQAEATAKVKALPLSARVHRRQAMLDVVAVR